MKSDFLADVRDSLEGIKAAILQTSIDEVRLMRVNSTRALKGLVFVGATNSTLGIVTLFGTAGTGTAISTLSGAALTSSQLAFLGLGSMASGVFVLSAIGFATSLAAGWMYKKTVYGKPRKFQTLSDNEVSIVSMIDSLVAPLTDVLETTSENHSYSREEFFLYAFDGLAPLQILLEKEFGSNIFTNEKTQQDETIESKLSRASRAALKSRFWGLVQVVEQVTNLSLNEVMTRLKAGVAPDDTSAVHDLVVMSLRQSVASQKVSELKLVEIIKNSDDQKKAGVAPDDTSAVHDLVVMSSLQSVVSQEVSELKLAEIIKNSDDQKIETLREQAKSILIEKLEDLKQPLTLEKIERVVIDTVENSLKIIEKPSKKLIEISAEKIRPVSDLVEEKIENSDAATKVRTLAGNAKDWVSKVSGDVWRKAKITKDKLASVEGTTVSEYNSETSQRKPQSRLASVVIAVCIERLVNDRIRHWTLEEDLVLQALRLAIPDLSEADITELSSYLRNSNEAQMRGVLATTKGKYHELIVAHAENTDGDEISARIFDDLNHPGSDIEFIVDGQVIEAVQLKAVVSKSLIIEHQSRYPDITIMATEEAASRVEGVDSSGFSNAQLQADVEDRLRELEGDGILDNVGDAFVVSALSLAAFNAKKIAKGDVTPHDLRKSAEDIAAGLFTTILLDVIV